MESLMAFSEKYHIIHSTLGLVHTLCAMASMIFGTIVLLKFKGTTAHKRLGYAYVGSMVVMNLTALGIYNFGKLNLFHFFALFSLITLVLGVAPAIQRKTKAWINTHYAFMSWSVVGLYCAFWAEVGVRLFDMRHFWWAVMLATILTSMIGGIVINRVGKKVMVKA
jgi:uncharacterized membrane protein